MDLRSYYKKLRETESTLESTEVVLVSLATSEGGIADVRTEAPRAVAARLIAEGRARAATAEETAAFRQEMSEAHRKYEEELAARSVQFVMVPARNNKKARDRS